MEFKGNLCDGCQVVKADFKCQYCGKDLCFQCMRRFTVFQKYNDSFVVKIDNRRELYKSEGGIVLCKPCSEIINLGELGKQDTRERLIKVRDLIFEMLKEVHIEKEI